MVSSLDSIVHLDRSDHCFRATTVVDVQLRLRLEGCELAQQEAGALQEGCVALDAKGFHALANDIDMLAEAVVHSGQVLVLAADIAQRPFLGLRVQGLDFKV